MSTYLSEEVQNRNLEKYALDLETEGLTIVPASVTGITDDLLGRCTEVLLSKFTELSGGCPISLEDGPQGSLDWSSSRESAFTAGENTPEPTQTLIQQLLQLDRCFRDLFLNPVVDALIGHMMGAHAKQKQRSWRYSSTNSFVKWQGDYGYGEHLGLHCDQGANPLPWGHTALTANATWCLTEYTKEDGALAYVPGSHKSNSHPNHPFAKDRAVAAECPAGSVIIWPGSTWHGAYPKKTPGLRLNAVAYYRHHSVLPQENMKLTMRDQDWQDCDDPEMMRELIGFDDPFPYESQSYPFPKLKQTAA
ncbi:MAG: phytanoyl-CoA dioxygenase family protein [Gammaproteobacteria bacterium]|nr:phytanoyl-CoA dioxygenase family protein [Gammaproteobacteria bacterium]